LLLFLCLANEIFDDGDIAGIGPVLLPGVLHNITVGIDQESLRIFEYLVQVGNLVPRIEESRQRKVVLLVKATHFFPIIVDADGKHLEFPVFVRVKQPFHCGHFFDTGNAPRAPDIQEDDFPAVIAQLNGVTGLILDRKVGCLLANVDDAWFSNPRSLPVDEVTCDETHDQKEDDGFNALTHADYCTIPAPRTLTQGLGRGTTDSPVLSEPSRIVQRMAITVSVLGSGSRGNATFVKTDQVRLLIDVGMSRKEIGERLVSINEDPDGVDAVLVTHEHTDHSGALRSFLKELPIRAFLTPGTIAALQAQDYELNGSSIVPVSPGVPFRIGDAEILPFRVPHDATEPVAFSVTCGGTKVTQLTDVGYVPEYVAESLRGSNMLILESNHDLEMLRVGPYPWNLKQRLIGRYGHLSNTAVGRFIREQYDGVAEHVLLAHLSAKNNHPEIARQEAMRALRDRGLSKVRLTMTSQDEATAPVRL